MRKPLLWLSLHPESGRVFLPSFQFFSFSSLAGSPLCGHITRYLSHSHQTHIFKVRFCHLTTFDDVESGSRAVGESALFAKQQLAAREEQDPICLGRSGGMSDPPWACFCLLDWKGAISTFLLIFGSPSVHLTRGRSVTSSAAFRQDLECCVKCLQGPCADGTNGAMNTKTLTQMPVFGFLPVPKMFFSFWSVFLVLSFPRS